jgi:hypothetical protein
MLDKVPLLSVIRQFSKESSSSTKVFYIFLAGMAALLIALPFSPGVRRTLMEKFHWRGESFIRWGVLQFIPSMYNFSNEIQVEPGHLVRQVNHFPLRVITFNPQVRQYLALSGQTFDVTLRSRFQGTTVETFYKLESQPPVLIFKNVTPRAQ